MTARWRAVAALVDPVRRALYDYVRRREHRVTREEAADACGISRNLAAFHLEKLVDAGLLQSRHEAPPDQPRGRGRAPKVYEPAGDGVAVTMPERRYGLVAEILADAVAEDPADARAAARRHARLRGQRLGAAVHAEAADGPGGTAGGPGGVAGGLGGTSGHPDGTAVLALLGELGFEPHQDRPGVVVLRNCPFHALAAQQRELICGLNLALVDGLLDGAGIGDLHAELAPRPGACCVELHRDR